jgi:response regulator of citrate/malate metabolism
LQEKLKSVLILEDEWVFSTILKHIVRNMVDGPFIAQAEDVTVAQSLLELKRFDLLLLNISLTNFYCTPEFIFSIKKRFPTMKIIVFSEVDLPDQRTYLNSGVHCFVKKIGDINTNLNEAIFSIFK